MGKRKYRWLIFAKRLKKARKIAMCAKSIRFPGLWLIHHLTSRLVCYGFAHIKFRVLLLRVETKMDRPPTKKYVSQDALRMASLLAAFITMVGRQDSFLWWL